MKYLCNVLSIMYIFAPSSFFFRLTLSLLWVILEVSIHHCADTGMATPLPSAALHLNCYHALLACVLSEVATLNSRSPTLIDPKADGGMKEQNCN